MSKRIKNIIGQKFGKLIVRNIVSKRVCGELIWECQCSCGKICFVRGYNLRCGKTKSCGCNKKQIKIDLTDKKFGKLTVKAPTIERRNNKVIWLCQCDCGKKCKIVGSYLTSGQTKSCGCLLKYFMHEAMEKEGKRYKEISGNYWSAIKNRAKKKNLEFSLTFEEAWTKFIQQERKCALSGQELIFSNSKEKTKQTASLDRINSTKGYTKENIQWLHKDINKSKQALSDDNFIHMCELIFKHVNTRKKT